ncbi:fumarate hydratase [Candidatus Bathyarchaeota archaeon]|nr:MAG: fumarate hydratase [Candidatus Bathyarchaeota archaeon]
MVEYKLKTPIKEEDVRKLRVGDVVYITGLIYTARDQAHRRILEYVEKGQKLPVDLNGSVIFHVGPLMRKEDDNWIVVSAGPTTSTRMNLTTPKLLENFKVRIIIGKGGMSREVAEALKRFGAVYCHFTGGAGVLAAKNIRKVEGVEWLDLGMPEALWKLQVEDFGPLTVTIDSNGNSLYEEVGKKVKENLEKILQQIG